MVKPDEINNLTTSNLNSKDHKKDLHVSFNIEESNHRESSYTGSNHRESSYTGSNHRESSYLGSNNTGPNSTGPNSTNLDLKHEAYGSPDSPSVMSDEEIEFHPLNPFLKDSKFYRKKNEDYATNSENEYEESEEEESQKRSEKSDLDPKSKKKQKVLKQVVKESYIDTMAEESEASELESEEDDYDDELDNEIPEELRDFITDEVVEDYEEEASDVEYDPLKFDEDDLELIAENTGTKLSKGDFDDEEDNKRLRRLKKGTKKSEPEAEDLWYDEESNQEFELSDVWATVAECFGQVDLVVQILKNERNPNNAPVEQYDSDYDPDTDPDNEPANDVDEELVNRVETIKITPSEPEKNLEQLIDIDELQNEYLTKEDEEIRQVDEPERLYIRYRNRPRRTDEREIQSEAQWMTRRLMQEFNIDLSKDSVKRTYEKIFRGTYTNNHNSVASDVTEKCELLLNWLLNERFEVPFILYHKRHLICPPLTDSIVWRVYQLDLEWVRLNTLSKQIQTKIGKIGHENLSSDILYYSTNFDHINDLNDVNIHLLYHHKLDTDLPQDTESEDAELVEDTELAEETESVEDTELAEETELADTDLEEKNEAVEMMEELHEDTERVDKEVEYQYDEIFGDFEPVDNPTHNRSLPSTPNTPTLDLDEPEDITSDSISDTIPSDSTSDSRSDSTSHTTSDTKSDSTSDSVLSGDERDLDQVSEVESEDSADMAMDNDEVETSLMYESKELKGDLKASDQLNDRDEHQSTDNTTNYNMTNYTTTNYTTTGTLTNHKDVDVKKSVRKLEKPVLRVKLKKNSSVYLVENIEKLGLDVICTIIPTADEFYKLLDKHLINTGHRDFRLTDVKDLDLDFTGMNFDLDIDQLFSPFMTGPFSTSKHLFNSIVDYYCTKYSTHISIRRLFREYFRNYCSITCVTTIKGEASLEVTDNSWFIKRMMRLPVNKLLKTLQTQYNYPYYLEKSERQAYVQRKTNNLKLQEMYLHMLKLQESGEINILFHPLTPLDNLYHKSDQYNTRITNLYGTIGTTVSADHETDTVKNLINRELILLSNFYENDQKYINGMVKQLVGLFQKFKSDTAPESDISQEEDYFVSNTLDMSSVGNNFYFFMCKTILTRLFHKYLIPTYKKEIKELLYHTSTNTVLYNIQLNFLNQLDMNTSTIPDKFIPESEKSPRETKRGSRRSSIERRNSQFSDRDETELTENSDNGSVMTLIANNEGSDIYMCIYGATSVYITKYTSILKYMVENESDTRHNNAMLNNWYKIIIDLIIKHDVTVMIVGLTNLYSLNLYYALHRNVHKYNNVRLIKYSTNVSHLIVLKYINSNQFNSNKFNSSGFNSNKVKTGSSIGLGGSGIYEVIYSPVYYILLSLSTSRLYKNYTMELVELWDEKDNYLLKLNYHHLQGMVSRDKLQEYINYVLMLWINKYGIHVNTLLSYHKKWNFAVQYGSNITVSESDYINTFIDYRKNIQTYLSFICGLGIRKAQMLLSRLRNFVPTSRNNMLELVGNLVFHNMASFIRFSHSVDSLDTTRIHPVESGFIAQKLCNGSLDDKLDGEDSIHEILANPAKLDELDLESYSVLLCQKQDMTRMFPYLLFIKHELQFPYNVRFSDPSETQLNGIAKPLNSSNTVGSLDEFETFYNVLKLDKNVFKHGTNVLCKFNYYYNSSRYNLTILPHQLKGNATDMHHFKVELNKVNPASRHTNLTNEVFYGRVLEVDFRPVVLENGMYNYKVGICLTNGNKRMLLNRFLNNLYDDNLGEFLSPLVKFDVNYNKYNNLQNVHRRKLQYKRIIRHPLYRIWNHQKVLTYLKQIDVPIGECCICPMNELDKLNLIIKTCGDPFNYVTFVIYEKNQRVPGELGRELYLQNEKYTNLDQISSQFVEILKLNLEECYTHPKFRNNPDVAKVERELIQESSLKPDNITWAIIPSMKKGFNNPLKFILIVIPPGFNLISEVKSLQDPIYVTHKSFRLWTHEEKSLKQLISWWKEYGYWHRNTEKNKFQQQRK
ncbi:SH2 domain protein [Theileria parva strain Muguga]|uniref:SH2 domain protein n=1 Tax=Theileria parva strain Muguga TaxID=333668 RepID=UPI001C61D252|nr:SH2 domain protein [Theileria parva strain Muguga]EAN30492.2 SH2 domain protein [Theileria parva strain Muguga]